jgi:hypothetical protein
VVSRLDNEGGEGRVGGMGRMGMEGGSRERRDEGAQGGRGGRKEREIFVIVALLSAGYRFRLFCISSLSKDGLFHIL